MDKTDITIDSSALDKECLRQPQLILQATIAVAESKRELDAIKSENDLQEAALITSIRTTPEKFGLVKVTEGSVRETLVQHKAYQSGQADFLEAKARYDVAQAYVTALEHKKRSLELLVQLHGTGYFGDPRIPNDNEGEDSRPVRTRARMSRK